MLLYLLRHADAEPTAATDDARKLTPKGREQAQQVARFLETQEIRISVLLASPVRRAQETATAVAERLRLELRTEPWLACGMQPATALKQLAELPSDACVMIVGHEPDFSQLAAHLLGLPSNTRFHVRKASLTLIQITGLRAGAGCLEFSIPSKLMS
jgi:phosphohistidine phosphatase